MQRFTRRNNRPLPGRRGPARWTVWELMLIVVSLLLIVFPLYAEAYRWINPLAVPAAPRAQEATAAPDDLTATAKNQIEARATDTAIPTGTSVSATNTPVGATPTATSVGTTPTDTPVGTTPTDTPVGATPTDTPIGPTNTASATVAAGTPLATLTPITGEPPLRLVKSASVALAQIGDRFNYSLSVFSGSPTARSVQVRDTLDSQLSLVSANPSNGTCGASGQTVTCNVSVQNNQPVTIDIVVQVAATATPGGRISNQASAQDDQNNTAASDQVLTDIGTTVPPAPTATGTTPGAQSPTPTSTTGPGTTPTATNIPVVPTATPTTGTQPQPPTSKPAPQPRATEPAPTTPPEAPQPPLPQPGPPQLPPTPRPGQPPANRTPVPGTGATAVPGSGATVTPVSPTPDSGLFFRMASDWGSAFVGQEINYVIAARNTRASGAMTNLVITSALPENLTILEAKSARGDPKVAGNQVTFGLDALQPGEGVEIAIRVKIKDTVAVGTRIVAQAELTYTGLALPARSNLVTVLIVGNALGPAAPAAQASTATATATRTAGPTASATATAAPSATSLPTATAVPPTPTAVGPAGGTTPLPNTSSGVPIFGFALLGMTLMVRTVRLHRAQSRI